MCICIINYAYEKCCIATDKKCCIACFKFSVCYVCVLVVSYLGILSSNSAVIIRLCLQIFCLLYVCVVGFILGNFSI